MDTLIAPAPSAPSAPAAAPAPVTPPVVPAPATPPPASAPSAPAPVAAPEALPTTEAEMIAFASRSLAGAPEATPASAANESPAAPGAVAPVPAPVQTSGTAPSGAATIEETELSPEVLASLGDPGKRAIEAEREKRRAKTAELTAANAEIERLKALLPAPAAAPSAAPEAPAAPAPAAPSAPVVPALAECRTSLEVTAAVRQATQHQALAMELNTVLNTEGLPAVVERLQASNIEVFRGIPVKELTNATLAHVLAQTYQQAEEIKLSAPQQLEIIDRTRASLGQAVTILPGLKDPNSAVRKEFNALANNPAVRALGPQWPVYVAQQILGKETATRAQAPAAVIPPLPPTPPPATVPGPGAPRVSVPPPQPASVNDAVEARLANGTATEADMKNLAAASLRGGTPLGAKK